MRSRLLDAAAERIAHYGIRKTTLDDIAKAAGCSRPTLYKYFGGKDGLIAALTVRETERYYAALRDSIGQGPATTSSLEKSFAFAVKAFREHPVVRGVLVAEPESFMRTLQRSGPSFLQLATDFVTPLIDAQVARGKFRKVNSTLVAEALIRLMISFVIVPGVGVDDKDDDSMIRALVRETVFKGVLRKG